MHYIMVNALQTMRLLCRDLCVLASFTAAVVSQCRQHQLAHCVNSTAPALCRGRLLVIYNLFPDYERVDSWAKRIRFYTWYSRSKNVITHLEKHQ